MSGENERIITSEEEITKEFLNEAMKNVLGRRISNVSVKRPSTHGMMSNVRLVYLEYEDEDNNNNNETEKRQPKRNTKKYSRKVFITNLRELSLQRRKRHHEGGRSLLQRNTKLPNHRKYSLSKPTLHAQTILLRYKQRS